LLRAKARHWDERLRALLDKELMTVHEVAEYLRKPVSWVYDNKRDIPHYKLKQALRFRRSEIDAWLNKQRSTN
jgi:excisionase family DNA binding protein